MPPSTVSVCAHLPQSPAHTYDLVQVMIPVAELDRIARARLDDAKALLAADRLDAAIYICGYAVEVSLKARICRILSWSNFPSTAAEFREEKKKLLADRAIDD